MEPLACRPEHPDAPTFHRFRSQGGEQVLLVAHSRIFGLPAPAAAIFDSGGPEAAALAHALGSSIGNEAPLDAIVAPTQRLSINVSSSGNPSCTCCYASDGSLGGLQSAPMTWEVARGAVDRLLDVADSQAPISVGFLGGEPFVNRRLIHRIVRHATDRARVRGLDLRFSVTTNGTLLQDEDLDLLRDHAFSVTVSIDGDEEVHHAQRSAAGGRSSFTRARVCTEALLRQPGRARVSARATVRRDRLDLSHHFQAILALGFPEVGFSPLRTGNDSDGVLRAPDWPQYLDALTRVARGELIRAHTGEAIRLTNLAAALVQLHRAIGSPAYELGDYEGIDAARRIQFLTERHVHPQAACATCWARYLCSGGCHHEASARTDSPCGFIRGWLEFCLAAYCDLMDTRPEYFQREAS